MKKFKENYFRVVQWVNLRTNEINKKNKIFLLKQKLTEHDRILNFSIFVVNKILQILKSVEWMRKKTSYGYEQKFKYFEYNIM